MHVVKKKVRKYLGKYKLQHLIFPIKYENIIKMVFMLGFQVPAVEATLPHSQLHPTEERMPVKLLVFEPCQGQL